jgi:dolichyl-phosphate-mannose--protein O-mannosyl transferase
MSGTPGGASGMRRRRVATPAAATAPHDDTVAEAAPAKAAAASGIDRLSGVDWAILAVLAVVGAVTRFYNIGDPRDIIFDETHFNKFSTWYVSRHYYVDIHPPLAKLAFAAMLWALGFKGAQEDNVRWW